MYYRQPAIDTPFEDGQMTQTKSRPPDDHSNTTDTPKIYGEA
jgi:hypothetical protein